MLLTLDIHRADVLHDLKMELIPGAEGRGEVLATLHAGGGAEPVIRLGRDFQLDGELAERLEALEGISNVSLTTRRGATHLRLVA